MKKTQATVALAVATLLTLSYAPVSLKMGPLGVDVVSAATGDTSTTPTTGSGTTSGGGTTSGSTSSSSSGWTTVSSSSITVILRRGSSGDNVKTLQTALNGKGYSLVVDGMFGPLTEAAVKGYQGTNGLVVDGIAGPKTLGKLLPASTTTTTAVTITRMLSLGSKGDDVKLVQANLNKNGYNLVVDGIFGPLTKAAVKGYQGANGLVADGIVGPKTAAKLITTTETTTPTTPTTTSQETAIKIGRAEYAAHGTKCFTVAVVAMAGDKIQLASVDDYQFVAAGGDYAAVPNSDKDFGKNYPAGQILISKRTNAAAYSANMAKSGGATQAWDVNMAGVESFVKGKTIAELETAIKNNGTDPKVDAVSGATFTDTNGYLSAILAAAKNAKENTSVKVDNSQLSSLKIGRAEYAAHGTKCFSVAVSVLAGDKIVADSVDDYQFMAPGDKITPVPNSDKDFGKNYPAGLVLISKRTNTEAYSANMKSSGGATQTWDTNMAAVEKFATGKTVTELDAAIKANNPDPKVDAVSGATFTDTNGYLSAILKSAKIQKASTQDVDVVASASVTSNTVAFEKALGSSDKGGKWIIASTNDLTFDHPIVVDGNFTNGKTTDASKKDTGLLQIQRKIGLYTQKKNADGTNVKDASGNNVTDKTFTLTAPKITILSPNASIEQGTVKGDIYVSAQNFQLKGATVQGNVFFTNKGAQDTFKKNDGTVTGMQTLLLLPETVDAYASASKVMDKPADFEKAISSQGNWIIAMLNNLTFDHDLVLDGDFKKAATDTAYQRKLAIYAHDIKDSKITTGRFVLTAPSLTIKSANANITKGMFVGDLYVTVPNFKLVDAIIYGNVYFADANVQKTFTKDATSIICGKQEIKVKQ